MRLYEAAIACRAYTAFGGEFDDSIREFVAKTGDTLDLQSDEAAAALMKWLNEWGCRQFAIEHHQEAITGIREWAQRSLAGLPTEATSILELTEHDVEAVAAAFYSLKEVMASRRKRSNGIFAVRVGETGAAKILYAYRPRALPPWDEAIRARLRYDGSAKSYAAFLRRVRDEVRELVTDAAACGVSLDQLPTTIERSHSTLPKIVDEYYWVTITRGFEVPTQPLMKRWSQWCDPSQPPHTIL